MKSFVVTPNGLDSGWMARAACRGKTDLFFPSSGGGVPTRAAKEVCDGCPVRRQCGTYAHALPEPPMGVWAGEMWRGA